LRSQTILLVLLFAASCKKYIEVDTPETSISSESAFSSNSGAVQVLTGIYTEMTRRSENGAFYTISVLPELSADNLALYDPDGSTDYVDYYRNSLDPQYLNTNEDWTFWKIGYQQLYTINTAIEQLDGNTKLNSLVAKRLLGEAYFMRAFYYFNLVNFYGEVPLVLSTAYQQTGQLRKSSSDQVYSQIISDLQKAEGLLDFSYVSSDMVKTTTERIRPNLAAVYALEARTYLYQKKYAEAENAATKVITQTGYALSSLEGAFLKNSTETIWGLPSVEIGFNTREAYLFLLPDYGPDTWQYPVYISESLLNSFEAGDGRKSSWLGVVSVDNIDYYYPAKYKQGYEGLSKNLVEYSIALRVAEQFLIRAEARNELNNVEGAVEDLNALRAKRRAAVSAGVPNPLPPLQNTLSQAQLRPIILNERRVELFTEGGHRWFDLRRSGTIDAVMTEEETVKGGTWAGYKVFYPIPRYDILRNQNLEQTPGYIR